jgi:serine protease inhibitor
MIRPALALLAAAAFVGGCGNATGPATGDGPPPLLTDLPRALTAAEQEAAASSTGFALALLGAVATAEPEAANVVLSPFSANVALGMAWAGASGETEAEMHAALGWRASGRADVLDAYGSLPALLGGLDPAVRFTTANALWARDGTPFSAGWLADLETHFGAAAYTGGFGAPTVDSINTWAADRTNGRITRVLDTLPPSTVGVLLNATWFKADWRHRFDAARTRNQPFAVSGSPVQVPMMQRTDTMRYGQTRGAQLVELPYGNGAFAMDVILPDAGVSPRAFLGALDPDGLAAMLAATSVQEVDLSLPRFTVAAKASLVDPLVAMGMAQAFDPQRADFARMGGEFFLSDARQDVWIRVDEEGTEAAAVTTVTIDVTSVPVRAVMTVDRPFLFLLRERLSGTVLFAGIVGDPRG